MPRAYLTLATKNARLLRAGRCDVSPVLFGFSNGKIFLPQNGTDEGTTALRARRQPSPPNGRQKLRQASGAPNRKFPAAPAEASAGFELRKRPAKIQLPASNPPPQRGFNGFAIPLQSAAMCSGKTLFPPKIFFSLKTLKLRLNYAGVFGAVHLQFPGLGQMRRKDRISEDFPIEGIEIQIRHIRRNCGKCSAGKGKFYREEDVPHRAVFLGKAILNTPHTSLLRTKYIYSHCIAKFRRTAVYGVKTDPQKCQGATANYASSRIKPDDAKTAHFCLWQIHI